MVGSADVGLTTEPPPGLSLSLLGCSTQAMDLVGNCVIRPHYTPEQWDKASETFERAMGLNVVRVPNGEGMMCARGVCRMVGMEHKVVYDNNDKTKPPVYEAVEGAVPHHEGKEADKLFKERGDYCEVRAQTAQKSGSPSSCVASAALALALAMWLFGA